MFCSMLTLSYMFTQKVLTLGVNSQIQPFDYCNHSHISQSVICIGFDIFSVGGYKGSFHETSHSQLAVALLASNFALYKYFKD